MRTTLTVDDDIADRLAKLAHDTRQPFKVVVNQILRRGLGELAAPRTPFDFEPHAGNLLPGIDARRFNELAFELDDERYRSR